MTDPNDFDRRRFLTATGSAACSLLAPISSPCAIAASASSPAGFGRAKSAVVLYLYGAPSQMDTLDPKPEAPAERRGEFGTIPSRLAGVRVCEHLPRIAGTLDRMCLVRSMTHTSNNHAVSVALSGLSKSQPAIEANRADSQHWPYFGSVLEYLWRQQADRGDTEARTASAIPGVDLRLSPAAAVRPEGEGRPPRQRHPALAAQCPDRPEPLVAPRGLAGTGLQPCLSPLPGGRVARSREPDGERADGPPKPLRSV